MKKYIMGIILAVVLVIDIVSMILYFGFLGIHPMIDIRLMEKTARISKFKRILLNLGVL